MRFSYLPGIVFTALVFSSCEKSLDENYLAKDNTRAKQNATASGLSYGASSFFLKSSVAENIITPVSKPLTAGFFKAIPLGLALDPQSGAIDLRNSYSGLKYKVFYIANTGKIVDSVSLVVSGVDYADGIYDINAGSSGLASPVYNANNTLSLPRGKSAQEENIFDETDLNNDGSKDIAGVNQGNLLVDKKSGAINLASSLRAGFFGSAVPANGARKDVTLYYRINDASRKALNQITLRVYYFKTKADIPQSLLQVLDERKKLDQRVNAMLDIRSISKKFSISDTTSTETGTGDTLVDDPLLDDTYLKERRPPLIIIVGQ